MNAKELTDLRNRITGAHNGINAEDLKLLYDLLPVVDSLSRSRIRDTATEPPTMEDGGTGNHAPYVMARENKHDFWEEIELEWVANHPDEWTQWTLLPEVE